MGVLITSLILPWVGKPLKLRIIQWWCRRLLAAFNIRIIHRGTIPSSSTLSNTLFVANHISWIDIHALNSVVALRFIAKADIQHWPIFGHLMRGSNTLFIDRSKRHEAAHHVRTAQQSLAMGDNLCLFPEGTTTDGTEIKPFKSSLIQAAIDANATLWPVAIRYPHPNGGCNVNMAYAGETTLIESLQQVLSQQQPVVELHFLTPITLTDMVSEERSRHTLAAHLRQTIRQQLNL